MLTVTTFASRLLEQRTRTRKKYFFSLNYILLWCCHGITTTKLKKQKNETFPKNRYFTRGFGEMCGRRIEALYRWPTCETHYDITTMYDSFYSWVWKSSYDPHGPVHTWVGGMVDCEVTFMKVEELVGHDIATSLAALSFIHRKYLYRAKMWKCAGGVTADVSQSPGEVSRSCQHVMSVLFYLKILRVWRATTTLRALYFLYRNRRVVLYESCTSTTCTNIQERIYEYGKEKSCSFILFSHEERPYIVSHVS